MDDPFNQTRSCGRIFHDFSYLVTLINPKKIYDPILDFAAGNGWITELLSLMGFYSVAFDIHFDCDDIKEKRLKSNLRIDEKKFNFVRGDGHNMPFRNKTFGTIVTFDSLHHMHTYEIVFYEFYRILQNKGRAIFVEPGARHSKSPETIKFLETMKHDPTWLEKDVILDEIDNIAKKVGFKNGISIIPAQHPLSLSIYNMKDWNNFRDNKSNLRDIFCNKLYNDNYNERVIFYVEK